MKYLLLSVLLLLLSCSKDNTSIDQDIELGFTLEVESSSKLSTIKVETLDANLNVLDTYSLNNTSELSVQILRGKSFMVHGYDSQGFSLNYTLYNNDNNTIFIKGGLGCNVYCFQQEFLN